MTLLRHFHRTCRRVAGEGGGHGSGGGTEPRRARNATNHRLTSEVAGAPEEKTTPRQIGASRAFGERGQGTYDSLVARLGFFGKPSIRSLGTGYLLVV